MAQDTEEVRTLIQEKAALAGKRDLYGLLGVEPDANKAQVQKAYFSLAKVLHPDRVAMHNLADVDKEAALAFRGLTDAYNVLVDAQKRKAYDAEAGRAAANIVGNTAELHRQVGHRSTQQLLRDRPSDLGIDPRDASRIFSHKGAMMMKKGAWTDAEKFFAKAHESDSENPAYNMQLGWAIFQNPERQDEERLRKARGYLEKAVQLAADNPDAHYYMARLHKANNDVAACRKHLKKALELKPNYIEVQRELRLLEMRAKKGGKRKKASSAAAGRWPFGLDRLFKKK